MPEKRSDEELLDLLHGTNEHFSGNITNLKRSIARNDSSRQKIETFVQNLGLGEEIISPDRIEFYEEGASEFVKILKEHPVYHGHEGSLVGLPIFGSYDPMNRVEVNIRHNAANLLASGLIALGRLGVVDKRSVLALIHTACSADIFSESLGLILSGKRIPQDFNPVIPPSLIDLEKELDNLGKKACGWAIAHTALDFSGALSEEAQAARELAKHPIQYRAYATGIESIKPDHGCGGQVVTIRGSRFGASPLKNLKVYFPRLGGGCTAVDSNDPYFSWTNTEIQVKLPDDVGYGYVGFVEKIGNWDPSQMNLAEAAENLAATMEMCIGRQGFAGAHVIRQVGKFHSPGPRIPCPGQLPNKENYFRGGPPYIKSFSVNNEKAVVNISPTQPLTVEWDVENASKIDIVPIAIGQQQNELPTLLSVQSSGTKNVTPPPQGNFAWVANLEIRAENECATVSRQILVRLSLPTDPVPTTNDFLWGVATSALQVEGNLTLNDWDIFAKSPKITTRVQDNANRAKSGGFKMAPPGHAIGHHDLNMFKQDLSRAKAIGMNTYRFSIEWSRIQPNPPEWAVKSIAARQNGKVAEARKWEAPGIGMNDNFDGDAIQYYRKIAHAILQNGLIPVLTLSHLSLPKWVLTPPVDDIHVGGGYHGAWDGDSGFNSSLRGWEDARILKAFNAFVEHVVPEFPGVNYWITLNEPVGSIMGAGYIAGVWSPGFLADPGRAKNVMQNLIKAHVTAFDTIKALRPEALVGIAHAMIFFKTSQNENWSGKNDAATNQLNYIFNEYFLNAVVHDIVDFNYHRDPTKRHNMSVGGVPPGRRKPKCKLDFIGVNYYRSAYVFRDDLFALATGLVWGGGYHNDMKLGLDPHNLLNDLGWEIYPEGLYTILKRLHDDYLQLPILITENGMPEIKDRNRAAYTISHLNQLMRAKDEGVNILGYIHWSIADNWEWQTAYMPKARFGIFGIPGLDGSDPTLPREISETAIALHYLIAENGNQPSIQKFQPAIQKFGIISKEGDIVEKPTKSAGSIWDGTLNIASTMKPITLYLSRLKSGKIVAMIFYHESHSWVNLSNIYWDDTTKILHFSHRIKDDLASLERRLFEATLANNVLNGTMIDEDLSSGKFNVNTWSAAKNNLHGVWNKLPAAGTQSPNLESLMINVFEGKMQAKCLLIDLDTSWLSFDIISVNSSGQIKLATDDLRTLLISGQISGNNMNANVTSPYFGLNFSWTGVREKDDMPF